jgi:tetratricopeptide (TPR) repeat protein
MKQPEEDFPEGCGATPASDAEAAATVTELPGSPRTPVPAAVQTFSTGELVAGRFRIVKFLSQGGMGEVYEAEDLELQGHVALKTIRPEIASDARIAARFKQEIQLARKVTHPNVCRVFDVFRHTTVPNQEGKASTVTFLTMELLRGETLAAHLRRVGRMSSEEALPLVEQMAAALEAAHKVGVIHRDFKSGNVMLAPPETGEGPLRAVVTDFGLARSTVVELGGAHTLTGAGGVVGTPAYMAPEQIEGKEASVASDIYALGVVMYEMVSGALPFPDESPLAAAVKRLREPPPPPRSHVPDLDPKWEAVILRCLQRDPAERFPSAMDVVKALPHGVPAKRRTAVLAGVLVLLAVLAAYYAGVVWKGREGATPADRAIKVRRSVAVLGFKNLSGRADAAWLSTALSEMLTTELASGEQVRTISGENVAQTKIDLALADTDSLAKRTLGRIRANLGADFVVLGSYVTLGEKGAGRIRLDLRLQDTVAGETVASVAETGTEERLFELVAQAGSRLRAKLGLGEPTPAEMNQARASMPSNPEAARLYAEGLERLRRYDALAAKDLLERATKLEPDYPLAHAELSSAWSRLGYEGREREEGQRAFDLSKNLSREERLRIEGRYWRALQRRDKAVEIYQALWNFFPDNLEHGLGLASAQTSAGKAKEALATVEGLRKLPAPLRDDPRIDLAEATACNSLGDYRQGQVAAGRAAAKGAVLGAQSLLADARARVGVALHHLGELDKALAAWEEAKGIYAAQGNRAGFALMVFDMAIIPYGRGDLAGAKKMYEEALAIQRSLGQRSRTAGSLNNIGGILQLMGDLVGAKKMYEEALAVYQEVGDTRGSGMALHNIGEVLAARGDLAGAMKTYEEALAIRRVVGDKRGLSITLGEIAYLFEQQGDLARAKETFEEMRANALAMGARSLQASALHGLGGVFENEGQLGVARRRYEDALALRKETGEKAGVLRSRLALAELSLEQGRPKEAETAALEIAKEFQTQKAIPEEVSARVLLARSLLAQGKPAAAQPGIERTTRFAERTGNLSLRLRAAVAAARVRAGLGDSAEAARNLNKTITEGNRAGLVLLEMQARLALGEVEATSGDRADGRARLVALEREARAKGLGLIASKAAARLRD